LKVELDRAGVRHEVAAGDLTDCAATSAAIADIGNKLGRIDGVVNNAGINDGVGLETGTPERFAQSLDRNLFHYYAIAHAALPFLKSSKGAIVNIGSKVALTGQGGTSGYAASKGSILGLTTAWAEELSAYGIRSNCVVPAEVATPQYSKWLEKFPDPNKELARIVAKVPLQHRMTDVDEIAAAVVFLLSEKSGITGQFLFVDGGYVHLDRGLT